MESEMPISKEMTPTELPHDLSVDASGLNNRKDDPSPVHTSQPGTEVKSLPLDAIERDEGLQARVQLDQATIDSYAEDMKQGGTFPPITVIEVIDPGRPHYLLVDGWHRLEANLQNGELHIQANVIQGTRLDALKYAASANTKNGLRRTNADKRKAVEMLLRNEDLVKYGDREVGQLAGVDHKTVGRVRAELVASGEIPQIEVQDVTRQGKTFYQRAKRKATTSQQKLEQQDSETLRDRDTLETHSQCTKHDVVDPDVELSITPEQDKTMEPDDCDSQGTPLSSEEAPTMPKSSEPFEVVQTFMAKRCISSEPVSQPAVMESINTWLKGHGLPQLTETEVMDALHRLGFRDEKVTEPKSKKTDHSWQWQGFQVLPSDAPDNKVDPFGLRHA